MEWVNAVVQGVMLGGRYALLACGLSMMFGVMRIVNLAHGAIAIAAAYLALWIVTHLGLPSVVALLVSVLVFALLGYLLQQSLFNRALGEGELAPLLVAFGLSIVVENLLQQGFSANSQSIQIGSIGTTSIKLLSGVNVGTFSLIVLVLAIVVIGLIDQFLARTSAGRAMRATSDDLETARIMGINNRHIYALATAIALSTVALAGVVTGMSTQFNPTYGESVLLFAFEAVIIGGLGSLWGTLAGAMVLGVAQAVGAQIDPAWGILAGHIVFLVVLLVRPRGLMPRVAIA